MKRLNQILLICVTSIYCSLVLAYNEGESSVIVVNNGSVFINGQNVSNGIRGNGKASQEQRQIPMFSSIQLSGGVDVLFRPSSNVLCAVQADENLIPLVKTVVERGILKIFTTESYSTSNRILVACSAPSLSSASLSGSGDIEIENLNGSPLSLAINGSGNILVTGTVTNLSGMVQGSGDISASGLSAKNGTLSVQGSGDINALCTESVTASVMGSGDILVTGSPATRNQSQMGSGRIKIR
ncbi:MAG: DUF2807 domain-containing protein [Candidatus Thiodiazotropha endolucinida]|nr:DUF2807 domain-containing protein [Candidatus Thiodiazotropha taylori]MCW4225456.1 DUF2807 domain-containing protein [Candidatus Thiodiazotropha endolucinida]MCG7887026.1 DUF2807 domain-containing protein [Candidatus Thiodiazotropha taylori]MCG7952970.1 DUF2807 domain-containing protein [Candidatus Thiodiazotropha taylori]MCG8032594.1 DUF2807 domain-containing protein [Candidatus Thiodiazotropha taylori]